MTTTTLIHGQCGKGTLYSAWDHTVACTLCNSVDVPNWNEITRELHDGETLRIGKGDALQVVTA